MTAPRPTDQPAVTALADLREQCLAAGDAAALLVSAAATLRDLTGSAAVLVHRVDRDGVSLPVRLGLAEELAHGLDLPELPDPSQGAIEGAADLTLPGSWQQAGLERASVWRLPGHLGHLVLAWSGESDAPHAGLALTLLLSAVGRLEAQERLQDLRSRVDDAQRLANMGDYDWHIASDINEWSDQLFRIYGCEPQSFNPSYERFLSFIHPDDRERIMGVHQTAYGSGEPYQMMERIVRKDGELRYLSSNGQVIKDEDGTPVRFRGTCIDITDRVLAEQERARTAERFRQLVESSPDAILVVDESQRIVQSNGPAAVLLGGDPDGRSLRELLTLPKDGEVLGAEATGVDGRALRIDAVSAALRGADGEGQDEALRAVFMHDATSRLEAESNAASLREAQVRRRQALEINDNVVQGLTAAAFALEAGELAQASSYLDRTIRAARTMMSDLLTPLDGADLEPGDLVRSLAASLEDPDEKPDGAPSSTPEVGPANGTAAAEDRLRVVVVDDSEDVRMLLRVSLQTIPGCEVVGEGMDGHQAVALVQRHQPDVVLLDLAMPECDGLQALPDITSAAPDARVIVLSGFDRSIMAEQALAAGASAYVEKGVAMTEIKRVIAEVTAPA